MNSVPSDEDIKEFLEMFGHRINDPKHQPKIFVFYWNAFKQIKKGK